MTALTEPQGGVGYAGPVVWGGGAHVAPARVDEGRHARVASSTTTRADLRRAAEAAARAERSSHALWRAWWLYVLLAGVLACGWLGVQSASAPAPAAPTVVTVPTSG